MEQHETATKPLYLYGPIRTLEPNPVLKTEDCQLYLVQCSLEAPNLTE